MVKRLKELETENTRLKKMYADDRLMSQIRLEALSVPKVINQMWSMDFMSDSLIDGRSIRTFNVVGEHNRKG